MSRDLRLILLDLPKLTREDIAERDEDLVVLEPSYLDGAIVGIVERAGLSAVLYSSERCIDLMVKNEGWTHEGATEFFEHNTLRSHMGATSPLFI